MLDPASAATAPFPRIHEGRYEVDPTRTGLRAPLPAALRDNVKQAGIRLLRVGVGCWLPSQDPPPEELPRREWFLGTTLEDTRDDACYRLDHVDDVLAVCADLDVDVLLSVDFMPASLARPGTQPELPEQFQEFVPLGYTFPDGVRNAPPADPEVFAAAAVGLLERVVAKGARIRYVELWNEPDLPLFYSGTFEEWWGMYAPFARAVHAAGFKVGGPSWAGAQDAADWLDEFVRRCADEGVPLDFYAFHRYDTIVDNVLQRCREVRAVLDRHGLSDVPSLLDEWGYDLRDAQFYGTCGNAAFTAACLMAFPDFGIEAQNQVLLVDPLAPEAGRLHGLTRKDGDPNPVWFAIEAFERFQATPYRIRVEGVDHVLAGVNGDRSGLTILVANPSTEERMLEIVVPGRAFTGRSLQLSEDRFDEGGWSRLRLLQQEADRPLTLVVPPHGLAEANLRLG